MQEPLTDLLVFCRDNRRINELMALRERLGASLGTADETCCCLLAETLVPGEREQEAAE